MEASQDHQDRVNALRQQLLAHSHRPKDDAALVVSFISKQGNRSGVVTVNVPEGACVAAFASPYRAEDYRRTQLGGLAVSYLSSSAVGFLHMLHDLENQGIECFVIDRCPRCNVFTSFQSTSMQSPGDVVGVWAIVRALQFARYELYVNCAQSRLDGDDVVGARALLVETAGHVTFEDRRVHELLREVARRLDDRELLREADDFLRFLTA
jgi:hypothetical protein